MMQILRFPACWLLVVVAAQAALAAEPDFRRDVRPILANRCFKCHGPDEGQRQSGLRLDKREAALAPAESGERAIVPGKPEASELVRRTHSADEDEMMPPPAAKNPLTAAERATLKAWVAAGAQYQPHWAFVPPKQTPLPVVKQADWPLNAIDRFVLARLEAEGLAPSPRAEKQTLVRRLYLDLIGLPPTPEETEAFVADQSPDAYERLIDRLLASPSYGERWARRWLDLARYADTNGYEKDRARSMWPYRDWVIGALNADTPFDQFSIEQLAGDMLPGTTLAQRVATGFHRNTMLNEEGGIDPLEFRFHAMTDRVNTTATVWLGLTLGCTQCHTHKYDPFEHREYYSFMAFLNNADEPEMDVPESGLAARRRELEGQIAAREASLADQFPPEGEVPRREHLETKFNAWLAAESTKAVKWTALRPTKATSNLPLLTVLEDDSILASSDQSKRDVYDLTLSNPLRGVTAIRLEVIPDDRLPKRGPGRVYYEGPQGDFFLSELTLAAGDKRVGLVGATQSFASGNNNAAAAIDGDPQTGWSIGGGQGQAHTAVFRLAEPLSEAGEISLQLLFEKYYAAGLGRFRVWATIDSRPVEARPLPMELEALLLLPAAERTAQQRQRLLTYYLSQASELAAAREEIKKLRDQLPAYPTTLVLSERPANNTRPTHRHHRGEFLQLKEPVEPNVLAALPPLPAGAPRDRLGLARWLVSSENPLVGRVTMNRHWVALFGRGLVRTTEDFGLQGELPTHPELLDYLAIELANQGWSIKRMHRLLVTSATYQQSSRATPELLARDRENRLLARGPRFRLEAELIRDAALSASGLLSGKLGGPSVFPPQPPGVSSEGAYGPLAWKVSGGEDRYRRGLYTFTKRTAPYAMFGTFDAPSGEACAPRRDTSNTPLQALTLLNDAVFVEAAQEFGRQLAADPAPLEAKLQTLLRRLLAREGQSEEIELLERYFNSQLRRLNAKELDAAVIAGPGSGDATQRAAWTLVARAIMNLDEMITKD